MVSKLWKEARESLSGIKNKKERAKKRRKLSKIMETKDGNEWGWCATGGDGGNFRIVFEVNERGKIKSEKVDYGAFL